jgi:quercetin dioxygenase-like cupin family protein
MEIKPRRASIEGPGHWFTGNVWLDVIIEPREPSRLNVAAVHFAPGARTAWHSHDGGQNLYVTEGEGRVQTRGEPVVTIRPGDVVHTPSGEWHWHGAAPDRFMSHLSLTEGPATWGDHVSEDVHRSGG